MAGLKTFVEEWNGHSVFAHPLKIDEKSFNKVIFLHFYNNYNLPFVQRWENVRAINRYQNHNFVKKWTQQLCDVNH